jgi:phenylacetate-CoA ligase
MSSSFHKTTYKLIQSLRGKKVFEVLDQLEKSQWYPQEMIREIQLQKIKKIIAHAYYHIPHYKKTFAEAGITPNQIKGWGDLKLVPILTKHDLRKEPRSLVAKPNCFICTRYSTSGSTGPPSVVLVDRNSEAYRHAAVFRSYRWVGFDIGERIAKFWGTQLDLKRSIRDQMKDFLLNRITFPTHFLDEKSMFNYYQRFRSFKPNALYGFSSAIYEFAQFLQNKNLPIEKTDIKAIIITGEPILPHQREIIEKTFACRVYNNYACEEFATIAFECPNGNLHLMSENVYVEVENQETGDGTGNLIITELNNSVMPLIRYRLSDVGILSNTKCNCGRGLPVLKEISGRSLDLIKIPTGRIIHGIYFDYLPKYFLNEIKQFQIVQTDMNTICVNLIKDKGFNKTTLRKFENKLRGILGDEVKIIIIFKEVIPRENTGKFRFVISKLS